MDFDARSPFASVYDSIGISGFGMGMGRLMRQQVEVRNDGTHIGFI
jgi:hypothetical protein